MEKFKNDIQELFVEFDLKYQERFVKDPLGNLDQDLILFYNIQTNEKIYTFKIFRIRPTSSKDFPN